MSITAEDVEKAIETTQAEIASGRTIEFVVRILEQEEGISREEFSRITQDPAVNTIMDAVTGVVLHRLVTHLGFDWEQLKVAPWPQADNTTAH